MNKVKKSAEYLKSFGLAKKGTFNFYLIEKFFHKKDKSNSFHVISAKTCNDLDFEELFMFLDRTISSVGQQYLYHHLRVIPEKAAINTQDEKIITKFLKDKNFQAAVYPQLNKLSGVEAYYITSLFQDKHLQKPNWYWLIPLFSISSIFALTMLFIVPSFIFLFLAILMVNLGIHYWNKRNLYQYLESIPELIKMNTIVRKLNKMPSLSALNPHVPSSSQVLDQISWRMSFFKLEAKLQGDIGSLFWVFFELLKIAFLLEPILLFGILSRLDLRRKDIETLYKFTGKIDLLYSIASLRKGLAEYCRPEIVKDNNLEARNVVHPLIPNCVSNTLQMQGKSVLLTGSNMSGKTSFIRTIAVNVICGMTINTCFANRFAMPKMKVFSAIRISDDLLNDKSYYFEEVLTIKEMIDSGEQDGHYSLFLLDEIFKGTNTIERISAGKAVLSALARKNLVFVSTHDIELADLLRSEFDLYHFSEVIENESVGFDYQLKAGKLKKRNAIRILQINGYPKEIIIEAIKISESFDEPEDGVNIER